MWMLLSRRAQVMMMVGLTITALLGLQQTYQLLNTAVPTPFALSSTIVFVIGTILVVIANFCWRHLWRWFPFLGKVLFPDLNGAWRGALKTTWKDANGQSPDPITVTIRIRQTLFSFSVQLETQESRSWSVHVIAEANPDAGRFRLWYSYSNQPRAEFLHRSTVHDGVAILEIVPDIDTSIITGHYYTARKTSGDIDVRRVES
jgi:hypothetical protein